VGGEKAVNYGEATTALNVGTDHKDLEVQERGRRTGRQRPTRGGIREIGFWVSGKGQMGARKK